MDAKRILSSFDFTKRQNWTQKFFDFDIAQFEKLLREKDESFWQQQGEKRALRLFHETAERVPAYKDFLRKHRIKHAKIKTAKDFQQVPYTDKKNYIDKYPLALRSWGANVLDLNNLIAVNAGTTGTLRLWPRGGYQEFEACIFHELIYKIFFEIDKYKTLLVVGFPIGMYVSGIATLLPSWMISNKKSYNLIIAPVGNKKEEVLDVLKKAKNSKVNYEQIILAGHPFFVKDILETTEISDIKPRGVPMKFLCASDGFTEEWRNYVLSRANSSYEAHHIINLYGSTDLLILGHESPLSILLKKEAESNPVVGERLFGNRSTANVFQYNPVFRYVEAIDGSLFFTAVGGIPLIRFDVGNAGDVIKYQDAQEFFSESDRHFSHWELPFIILKGRNNYVLEFYLAHIDPEYIRQALDDKNYFHKLTGKFTIQKTTNKRLDHVLEINIELNKRISATRQLQKSIEKTIIANLRKCDYRYDVLSHSAQKLAKPRIRLWPYQHPKYFQPGIKPRYIVE